MKPNDVKWTLGDVVLLGGGLLALLGTTALSLLSKGAESAANATANATTAVVANGTLNATLTDAASNLTNVTPHAVDAVNATAVHGVSLSPVVSMVALFAGVGLVTLANARYARALEEKKDEEPMRVDRGNKGSFLQYKK